MGKRDLSDKLIVVEPADPVFSLGTMVHILCALENSAIPCRDGADGKQRVVGPGKEGMEYSTLLIAS